MWIALRYLASGALDAVLRCLSAALEWVFSDVRNALLAAFVPAFLWAAIIVIPDLREDLAASERLVTATQIAHLGTITNFIDASNQAQAAAEANAARVKSEQERITDATLADLRVDNANLRARFARLRSDSLRAADAARTDPGHADPAGLPGTGNAPGRADAAPADPDLRPARASARELSPQPLCPPGLVCLTIDEAEAASEDAHRHNRLIDWLFGQSAVRFTPSQSSNPEPAE